MTRFSAIGICLVGILSSSLIGCGDGETGVAKTSGPGAGGAEEEGGAAGATAQGGSSSGGKSGGAGQGQAGAAEAGTTSKSGAGGKAAAGSAGAIGSGGSAGVAGSGVGQGGATTAGNAGTGGATTAGNAGTGGATTAGNAGTGGATTAGNAGTGGATTAGNAGTGGVATGGTATGGAATGGTTSVPVPCTANFVLPADGETLTEADDVTGAYCANGFFYDVIVATDAPNGTTATLTVGNGTPIAAIVQNAVARFASAQMGTSGTQSLSIQVAASTGLTACTATESVTVNCLGHSTCSISKPTFLATHVALNGVAVAQGGDRVSSEGSPYQAAFEVTTDIENGQPVALTVTNGTTPSTLYAVAMAGKATFPGVTFVPDGSYTATATCQARSGAKATSLALPVPVDTTGPDLTVTKGAVGGVALADGDHFGPTDLVSGALRICGATAAADALGIDSTVFGSLANNFCVSTGGNAPVCAPALSSTGNGACVNFPCPGNGPFDLTVTLKDKAQNANPAAPAPLKRTWSSITCAASNPTVTFVDPVADTAFTDPTLRILANGNSAATRRDKNGTLPGAQYDVVACTSAPPGSTAVLRVGRASEALSQVGQVTVAAATSVCPTGSQGLIAFPDVTLPESLTDGSFGLAHATQLAIVVTDLNFGQTTDTANVWVDSMLPTLTLNSPVGFCGSYIASGTAVTRDLVFGSPIASPAYPVNLVVTNPDGTQTPRTGTTLTFSQATISAVAFAVGTSSLTASVAKPSGNIGTLAGSCAVQVGSNPPPTVTWVTPTAANDLGAVGNTRTGIIADASAAAGWQGELRACTSLTGAAAAGMTVTFAANGTPIGTPLNIDQTTGCVSLNPATVPEGPAVQLTATTSVGTAAAGNAAITVTVDVTPPDAPTNLVVTTTDRRQTTFHLAWKAGADGSGAAAGYDVRVARSATAIAAGTFSAAEAITYAGTPVAAGQTDGIDIRDRYIENSYQFALKAVDSVGNTSPILATATPAKATFTVQTIPALTTLQNFGWVVDGGGDINGDGYSDLLVAQGLGTEAYIFFGSASGIATTPSVRIQGTVGQTGYASAVIGDINKDGFDDFAIGVFRDGDGRVLVYYGRANWPAAVLTPANANSVITTDRALDANYAGAQLGSSLGRIGDFNGDGVDDFALGMTSYNVTNRQGQIAIVPGKVGGIASSIVLPAAFGVSATRIDGDASIRGYFGNSIVGIGRFGGTAGPVSFVTAAASAVLPVGSAAGRYYAFAGVSGVPTQIALTSAFATLDGTAANEGLGGGGATLIGDIGPGGQVGLGLQLPHYLSPGRAYFASGTAATGPFAANSQVATAETPVQSNGFSRAVIGGALHGKATALSFIGTSKADFAISTKVGTGPRLFVVDGTKFALGGALVNAEGIADVVMTMPSGFADFGRNVRAMRDLDGDGYADFAVGDVSYVTNAPIDGRVLVYR